VGRLAVGTCRQDHAVVLPGSPRGDLALHDIEHDERRLALERIAPPAAARGLDAHEGTRGNRLVIDQAGQDSLARPARVDRDAERLPGPPTCEPPRLEGEGCLNAYGQCDGDLVCLPYAGVAEGGVCGARVAAGNVCDDAQDCQAGLTCNAGFPPSRCEPLSEIGQPCGSVQDCKSLNCDLATAACAPSAAATTGW